MFYCFGLREFKSKTAFNLKNPFKTQLFVFIFIHLSFTESEFCGVFHQLTGTLDSPNYPNNYPNNYHCLWLITLPSEDERVGIHIVDLNVESHSTCKWDALEVGQL